MLSERPLTYLWEISCIFYILCHLIVKTFSWLWKQNRQNNAPSVENLSIIFSYNAIKIAYFGMLFKKDHLFCSFNKYDDLSKLFSSTLQFQKETFFLKWPIYNICHCHQQPCYFNIEHLLAFKSLYFLHKTPEVWSRIICLEYGPLHLDSKKGKYSLTNITAQRDKK